MRFEISANTSCRWASSALSTSNTDPAFKEMGRLILGGFFPLVRLVDGHSAGSIARARLSSVLLGEVHKAVDLWGLPSCSSDL